MPLKYVVIFSPTLGGRFLWGSINHRDNSGVAQVTESHRSDPRLKERTRRKRTEIYGCCLSLALVLVSVHCFEWSVCDTFKSHPSADITSLHLSVWTVCFYPLVQKCFVLSEFVSFASVHKCVSLVSLQPRGSHFYSLCIFKPTLLTSPPLRLFLKWLYCL